MKRYDSYKDSGVKWIGEIPSHWNAIKLKYKLQLINEKIVPNGLQYVGMENIESFTGKYVQSDIKAEGLANHFQAGDILFGKLRPYLAKAYQCKADGCCSTELLVYRNKEYSDFFKYTFLAKPFVDLVNSSTYGSKMPRANANFIGSQFIPVPPASEQRAIVSFLDTELGKIDTYMDKEQQLIERLKELKQSLIARAVTHGINPNVKMKPSGINWIGEIPEHWKTRKIKNIFRERSVKGYTNEPVLCATQKYGVIPQNMYENRVVVVNKGLEGLKLVRKGDFVISLRSFQGGIEYAHYQGIISAAYTVLNLSSAVNAQFMTYLLKSFDFIQLLKTCVTGIREGQNINYGMLKKNSIALPPASEQRAIVDYLQDKTSKIDKLITKKTRELEYMKELRQRIISDAVTGKIDVRS